MMLTEKECMEALKGLRNLECCENFKKWNQVAPQVKADVIERLIKEHFSNRPLTWGDIKHRMVNKWVWHDGFKRYFKVKECLELETDGEKTPLILYETYVGSLSVLAFKENCFFRKEVEYVD